MKTKFFQVTAKPLVPASKQHAGNITDDQILADWTPFKMPAGAARLIGLTITTRAKNGVDYNMSDFEIIFASGRNGLPPASLGTVGAAVGAPAAGETSWFNLLQGRMYVDVSQFQDTGALTHVRTISPQYVHGGRAEAATAANLGQGASSIVLQPDYRSNGPDSDLMYMALIVGDSSTVNYSTTLDIDGEHTAATTKKGVTVANISALNQFAPGDIIHDEDDQLVGTIKSVDSTTKFTLEDDIANTVANDKKLYNINPFNIKLSFEK